MIPYTLIVTSAARPHCLKPTLKSLVRFLDQIPQRVVIHEDAVFPEQWSAIKDTVREALDDWSRSYRDIDIIVHQANPPRRLGPAVAWCLAQAQQPEDAYTLQHMGRLLGPIEYVLYSQDDHVAVRPVPVAAALDVMQLHHLHHVRFNKRATLAVKETWAGPWAKEERRFEMAPWEHHPRYTLTVSDHWYFQLSLWRAAEMQRALTFWRETPDRWARLAARDPEEAVNHYFDHVAYGGDPLDPRVRATCQRTFIWGSIGEDRYVRHIGGSPSDWRGDHARRGGHDDPEIAWREIASYPGTEGLRG